MKIIKLLLFAGLLVTASLTVNAQILAWEFNGNAGNEATVNSTTTNANINTSTLSRGAGIDPAGLLNAFSSDDFAGTTLNEAITNQEYLQFTVSPQNSFQVSLSTLDVNFRRSSTGPDMFQWQYSLDGFMTAGTNIGGTINYTNTTTNGVAQAQIDLSGIAPLQNVIFPNVVTFRLYGGNASATTGTFAFGRLAGNDLAIGGTIMPVLSAPAQVGGRVIDSNGYGISKAQVKISGGDLSEPMTVITSPFGYYSFEVPAGQTYIVSVGSKNYTFSNPTRVINVNDNVSDLDFTADAP